MSVLRLHHQTTYPYTKCEDVFSVENLGAGLHTTVLHWPSSLTLFSHRFPPQIVRSITVCGTTGPSSAPRISCFCRLDRRTTGCFPFCFLLVCVHVRVVLSVSLYNMHINYLYPLVWCYVSFDCTCFVIVSTFVVPSVFINLVCPTLLYCTAQNVVLLIFT